MEDYFDVDYTRDKLEQYLRDGSESELFTMWYNNTQIKFIKKVGELCWIYKVYLKNI